MAEKFKQAVSILLLTLAPPAVLFVLFDYAASYLAPTGPAPSQVPKVEYFEFDPLQMWRLRPGFSSNQIHISPEGFRTPLPPLPENKKLVFVIGGSSVFGVGMPEEKTVAYFLQRLCDMLQPEKQLAFINAGVTGYYSTQEFIHLQRHVLPHKPVLVIALTGRNDAFYGLHPQFQPDAIPYHGLLREQLGALDPYYTALESPRQSLHVLNWLRQRRKSSVFDWLGDFKKVQLTYRPAATEVFVRNANSMHALLSGQGVGFRLYLQPTITFPQRDLAPEEQALVQDSYLAPLNRAYAELARECSSRLPQSWFRGMVSITRHKGQMFIDNVHFNEDGARQVAREIYTDIYGPIGSLEIR